MRRLFRRKTFFSIELLYSMAFLLVTLFLSVGYSAFSVGLDISDIGATVELQKDIRVSDVVAISATGNAVSNYEEHNSDNVFSSVSLPNSNSSITYNIAITNLGNVEMGILNISGLPSNLTYSMSNYNLKDTLCDSSNPTLCKLGSVSIIEITVGYTGNGYNSGNTDYQITLNFDFERVYSITYNGFSSLSWTTYNYFRR